jgi:8-oxo-dGTP pyrophosphatase MutT (NUDIX family)
MQRRNGPWKILSSRMLHRDHFIAVKEDRVIRPDGTPGRYATVRLKPGVIVLPVEDDGTVCLISQFRYGLGRSRIEAVSGGIDRGETPRAAAVREVREEAGVVARKLIPLGELEMEGSILLNHNHLFLARHLRHVKPEREATEHIEVVRLTLDRAVENVLSGGIDHGPTCVILLKAWEMLGRADLKRRPPL